MNDLPHRSVTAVDTADLDKPQSAKNLRALKSSVSATGSTTYHNQDDLPRLPIPDLATTLTEFQKRLEALQDDPQRAETARAVQEFLDNEGPELQRTLQEYEQEGFASGAIGSYVEEFWNESYLSPDESVVLNLNPFFVLESGPDPKIATDQLRRAASLCLASLKMASVLHNETLTPDYFRGVPLCMDQFKALFGSSRQPQKDGPDDVHVFNNSGHVVVLCKNQFYYFSALWPETADVAVDEADILDILKAIQKNADQTDVVERSQTALGVFTSLPRSKWAVAREDLCQSSEINKTALNLVDSALFVLVLDDYLPSDIHDAAANMLHGNNELQDLETLQVGSCLNRWYDKLQLIVCKDGTSGLVFEHSIIDGHTALRMASDVYAETVISFAESIVDLIHGRGRITHVIEATVHRVAVAASTPARPMALDVLPKKIVFDLSESIKERIYYAETALCDDITACDTFVLEFRDYGKQLIVANKISPDAFVQMSILLAYYRLYGRVECMYEPALTKRFYHGRTEAIRGTTVQAKAFCEIWCNRESTPQEKLDALKSATVEHSRLTKKSSMGLGVDRHLYALKCVAARQGLRTPRFFKSEGWKTLNHTVLSTSNCGNPALRLFGFGPVVPDGFGIGYIIKDIALSYVVATKHRQSSRYVRSLQVVLTEMQKLLQPISTIEVESKRPPLSILYKKQSSVADYGDMWGSNNAIRNVETHMRKVESSHFKPLLRRASSASKYFAQVKEQPINVDLRKSSNFVINVSVVDEQETTSEDDADEEVSKS